jgi:DNA-binding beta-propeller fold protein YncE
MKRVFVVGVALLAFFAIFLGWGPRGLEKTVAAQASQTPTRELPTFQVDPSWPKKLPNNWVWGPVSGLTVDSKDHVWVITRPREIVRPEDKGKTAAPSVMEFDGEGNYIQGWGGPGEGYEWPDAEHGVTVDYKGFVWIAGRGKDDDQILKFTNTGKFVMQIGHSAQSKGNSDTVNVNLPADVTVYPKTNEVFVADGYGNRRIIVFDADTGKFKRMWGAFGNVPTDPEKWTIPSGWKGTVGHDESFSPDDLEGQETLDAEQGPQQFANVHSVRVSNDGLVYVCDRKNQRLQVFTIDGKYLTQIFISRGRMNPSNDAGTLFGRPRKDIVNKVLTSPDTASRATFSPDPQQRFLYIIDRRHQRVLILNRKTLEILGSFGGGVGDQPGQFYVIHDMATDSHGNIYTAEIKDGTRAQKFVFKGMVSTQVKINDYSTLVDPSRGSTTPE